MLLVLSVVQCGARNTADGTLRNIGRRYVASPKREALRSKNKSFPALVLFILIGFPSELPGGTLV